ncbi:MAG: hypothetical protein COA74_08570 [Gammaproteobacteria bacterium]|nr:MAG: hypothetical protein COA74_08570 [Gammaproteobacteria bacterium]
MNLLQKAIIATALSLTLAAPVVAHQTFLAPEKFNSAIGEQVNLAITSALAYPNMEGGPSLDRIPFIHVMLNGQKINNLTFTENETYMNASFTADNAGFATAAMSSKRRFGEIKPEEAANYLDAIGVNDKVKAAFLAQDGTPVLNRSYNKHTKTFFCVETCGAGKQIAYEAVGQALEFVASNEAANHFILLLNGKPLVGHDVTVVSPGADNLELNTNQSGAIDFDTSKMKSIMMTAVWVTLPEQVSGVYQIDYATLTVDFSK